MTEATPAPDRVAAPWVCMDCGNDRRFQVIYYAVCSLDQSGPEPQYETGVGGVIDDQTTLQVGCAACQSVRVGRRQADESGAEAVVPGRWVRSAAQGAPADAAALRESLDEVAPSLGVPEVVGSDGSLQWEVENLIAGTRVLVGFMPEKRTASVYARSGNAFIGYAALGPITSILTDLDQGEVQFIQDAGREQVVLSVTEEGVFFVRSSAV